MVSVHTGPKATLSQRPIIEQLFYIYGAAHQSAATITFCLEMEAVNEKNWGSCQKMGSSGATAESHGQIWFVAEIMALEQNRPEPSDLGREVEGGAIKGVAVNSNSGINPRWAVDILASPSS